MTLPTAGMLAVLREKWAADLPVWAIAADLRTSDGTVQGLVRKHNLPHRDPVAVWRAGRARTLADQRAKLPASSDWEPLRTHAHAAAVVAEQFGVAWTGRRDDLAELNRRLNGLGHRPIFVPFRELRP